jgi:hypothetical protein
MCAVLTAVPHVLCQLMSSPFTFLSFFLSSETSALFSDILLSPYAITLFLDQLG